MNLKTSLMLGDVFAAKPEYYGLGARLRWSLPTDNEQIEEVLAAVGDSEWQKHAVQQELVRVRARRVFETVGNGRSDMCFTIYIPVAIPGLSEPQGHPIKLFFNAGLSSQFHRLFEEGRARCCFLCDDNKYRLEIASPNGSTTNIPLEARVWSLS